MAKLPALISALDLTSQRERSTIEHIARVIREAGFIPTTKRGPGASDMGAREAANLLLAVAGSDLPKDAPIAVDSLRSLERLGRSYPDDGIPEVFAGVHAATDFGTAVEALIDNAARISAFGRDFIIKKNNHHDLEFIKLPPEIVTVDELYRLKIEINLLHLSAKITAPYFQGRSPVERTWEFWSVYSHQNLKPLPGPPFDPFIYGRIQTIKKIGLVPIFKLWAAVNDLPHANGPTELSL